MLNNNKNSNSITCIDSYDFTENGSKNLIIGRTDGNIEAYAFNITDLNDTPILLYIIVCSKYLLTIKWIEIYRIAMKALLQYSVEW